jgi:GDP-L-fucose synthase
MTDLLTRRITVTGGAGFLGRAVCRSLIRRGVPPGQIFTPRSREYDLTVESQVLRLYDETRPDIVIHLAAEVGGIGANRRHPGRFFFSNMAMGLHLVEIARARGVEKFLHVGTVCAYPKHSPVPFNEEDIWNGYPEETNAPYGIAKKAIGVMLDGYRREYGLASAVVVPVNLYGPGDNFNPETSHVIPALIQKCEQARVEGLREIVCWGTGRATREFLHVDDAAEGVVRAAEVMDDPLPINLGGGQETTIRDLASEVASACGYNGKISWDETQPDGQPRRALDITRARMLLGWEPRKSFAEGLAETVEWWRGLAK